MKKDNKALVLFALLIAVICLFLGYLALTGPACGAEEPGYTGLWDWTDPNVGKPLDRAAMDWLEDRIDMATGSMTDNVAAGLSQTWSDIKLYVTIALILTICGLAVWFAEKVKRIMS